MTLALSSSPHCVTEASVCLVYTCVVTAIAYTHIHYSSLSCIHMHNCFLLLSCCKIIFGIREQLVNYHCLAEVVSFLIVCGALHKQEQKMKTIISNSLPSVGKRLLFKGVYN